MITISSSRLAFYIIGAIIISTIATIFIAKPLINPLSQLKNYNKKPGKIPIEVAKKVVKKYYDSNTEPGTTRSRTTSKELVTSVYFEFGTLASYMVRMLPSGASGMRIYFAEYDSTENREVTDENGKPVKMDLKGYNTVVLVATKEKTVNGITNIVDILTDANKKPLIELYQPTNGGYNGGVSCPPYPSQYCRSQGLKDWALIPGYIPEN